MGGYGGERTVCNIFSGIYDMNQVIIHDPKQTNAYPALTYRHYGFLPPDWL